MPFQRCPLCEGVGAEPGYECRQCTVCRGEKVINSETGRPPGGEPSKVIQEISDEELAKELLKVQDPLADMTEDEITYWATPYYDELQAKKEAHAKKIEGEKNGKN